MFDLEESISHLNRNREGSTSEILDIPIETINDFMKKGYLNVNKGRYKLTEEGIEFYKEIYFYPSPREKFGNPAQLMNLGW